MNMDKEKETFHSIDDKTIDASWNPAKCQPDKIEHGRPAL
jgi:hypothetical protein